MHEHMNDLLMLRVQSVTKVVLVGNNINMMFIFVMLQVRDQKIA